MLRGILRGGLREDLRDGGTALIWAADGPRARPRLGILAEDGEEQARASRRPESSSFRPPSGEFTWALRPQQRSIPEAKKKSHN